MRRREFIALLGGATALPLAGAHAVYAQPATTPLVGFLYQGSAKSDTAFAEAFRKGLSEAGFAEGKNVTIDYRWADGQYDRLPQLAADLVGRKVSAIAAAFAPATHAAIAASSTIPIVFVTGTDPVRSGLVSSFDRPGGNVTGFAIFVAVLGSKQLGLLHDFLPAVGTVALLVNPANPFVSETYVNDVQTTAHNLGLQIVVLRASTDTDIDNAFATMIERRIGALTVAPDTFLRSRGGYIVAMTLRHAIPTMYSTRDFTTAGGLMSYDTDLFDGFRQQGRYVGRILKGEKVGELPVLQPTEFRFVINLKTAKALGLTIPPGVLAIADEVLE
jgi:putative tryptophan/tyrosine transport system substrate-binding protein